MTTALVVAAGAVGVHATRQLVATPGVERVLLADHDRGRARAITDEAGERVTAVSWRPGEVIPAGVTVLVSAASASADATAIEQAVEAGLPAVSCADGVGAVRRLLDLAPAARAPLVVGAGLAPGLSEVLAARGSEALDTVDEVHVARYGVTGPACRRASRRAAWGRVVELDDGAWTTPAAGSSRRLVYFPDPVGPHDCRRAANAVPILVARALAGVRHASVRHAMRRLDRLTGGPAPPRAGPRRTAVQSLGAVHVEVRGFLGRASEVLAYGAVDQVAAATGAVLATAAAAAAGLVPGCDRPPPGVRGLAELAPPGVLLAELARRGVRCARFEP